MRQLRVAIIGGGFMGKAHSLAYALAPIAEDLGATIIKEVLVDVTPELASDLAAKLGWASSSSDWSEIVDRPDIDIVDICTPPQHHGEIALAAIAAGKHVFCEKPLANSAAEAKQMYEAALKAGIVTQVGFNYRHSPAVAFAKQLFDAGRFGEPLVVRASYLQDAAFTAEPGRWRALKGSGGSGVVGDIGSHVIDLAEYLFGDIVRVAARVRSKSTAGGWVAEEERTAGDLIDDAGVWIAEFANGAIGNFSVNSFASGQKNHLCIAFDASRAVVEFDWNEREVFKVSYVGEERDHEGFRRIHTNSNHPNGWWGLAGLGTGYIEIMATQFQKFIMAIMSGGRGEPDFENGYRIQQVVEAVWRAATTDTWVEVSA